MKRSAAFLGWGILIGSLLGSSLLTGCASFDRLSEYRFRGRSLGTHMLTPPAPRVYANYDMRVDRNDPVGSVLRVGTGLAMAAQVHETQTRLTRVLDAVSVPEEIRRSALERFSQVLDCEPVLSGDRGDVVLVLDIREYGIEAQSWSAASEFRVSLRVSLRDGVDGGEIWRARVEESTPISPAVFGLGGAVGNVLNAVALSELSDEQIGRGMMILAQRVADRAAQRLERDLERAGIF